VVAVASTAVVDFMVEADHTAVADSTAVADRMAVAGSMAAVALMEAVDTAADTDKWFACPTGKQYGWRRKLPAVFFCDCLIPRNPPATISAVGSPYPE